MKIQTKTGTHEVDDRLPITDRTKWWVETITDVIKPVELCLLFETALREAYDAGRAEAYYSMYRSWNAKRDVVEADFQVIPNTDGRGKTTSGPEYSESAAISQADGSAEQGVAGGSVHGGGEEVPRSE